MSAKTLTRRELLDSLLSSARDTLPAVVSGTTGSPASSSITGYALTTWTGNGSFTVSVAGLVRILVAGGGGGGNSARSGGTGGDGVTSRITGTSLEYGAGGDYPGPVAGVRGGGASGAAAGGPGSVHVRWEI